MSPSNPEWYEELQEHPLRTNAFTERLAWQIRESAISGAGGKRRGRLRFAAYGAAVAGAAIILLFSFTYRNDTPLSPNVVPSTAPAVEPTAPVPEELPLLRDSVEKIASKPLLTDYEWQKLIVANTSVTNKQMIGKQRVGEFMVVLWKSSEEKNDIEAFSLGYDQFKWDDPTGKGWSRLASLSMSALKENGVVTHLDSHSGQSRTRTDFLVLDNGTLTRETGGTVIPISYGMVIDPRIEQVKAMNVGNDRTIPVQTMKKGDITYWFALPPIDSHEYKLEGLDAEGTLISSETRYYN